MSVDDLVENADGGFSTFISGDGIGDTMGPPKFINHSEVELHEQQEPAGNSTGNLRLVDHVPKC